MSGHFIVEHWPRVGTNVTQLHTESLHDARRIASERAASKVSATTERTRVELRAAVACLDYLDADVELKMPDGSMIVICTYNPGADTLNPGPRRAARRRVELSTLRAQVAALRDRR